MRRMRELGLVLVTAAVIFFAMQNMESQRVAFLWFDFSVPLSLVALVPLLIGLLVGAGTALVFGHRKGKRERERMRASQAEEGADLAGEEDEPGRLPSGEAAAPHELPQKEGAGSERSR